uniref:Uncharacterized protein LOC114343903 n=1 Tax=Diabrotica virgifera virgifera TaxID=50390 RepID=A0A6P7GLJ6_DIAVI
MNCKLLTSFVLLFGCCHAALITGKNGLLDKVTDFFAIDNIASLDANARAKVLNNEIGADLSAGIGKQGIGAYGQVNGDVLGQKANVQADILNGREIDQRNHEVYRDNYGRQYTLKREYVGSKLVMVRQYLDDGQIYVEGKNDDNEIQYTQPDNNNYMWDERTGQYILVDPSYLQSVNGQYNPSIYYPSNGQEVMYPNSGDRMVYQPNTQVVYENQPGDSRIMYQPGGQVVYEKQPELVLREGGGLISRLRDRAHKLIRG